MAVLAQSLELLPGISVMWTPLVLSSTQPETDFKGALLLLFKRKLLLPPEGKHSLASLCPAFPFPCHTAHFVWRAAALSASKSSTSSHQCETRTRVFLIPQLFPPWQGALAERQGALARFLCPEALQKDTLLLLLPSNTILSRSQEVVVFGAAVFAIQNKHFSSKDLGVGGGLSCFLSKADSHFF